jgi:hypothetical protein
MTYYAWSNFTSDVEDKGQIKVGEKISQDDLGVPDVEWKELIKIGAVREEQYPKNLPSHRSPMEYERSKIIPKVNVAGELMLPRQHAGEAPPVEEEEKEEKPASVIDKALGLG